MGIRPSLRSVEGVPLSARIALFAALLLLAAPAAAQATTTSLDGTTLRVIAAAGETNVIAITSAGSSVRVFDSGAGATNDAGPGCVASLAAPGVLCPSASVTKVVVEAGDQNDIVTTTVALPHEINGGPGSDQLTGGPARDSVLGDEGDDAVNGGGDGDSLIGGDGNDTLHGGDGDDTLNGRAGADVIYGDAGSNDTVDYGEGQHNAGVTVTIGALADDGLPGEGDDVKGDVEAVYGSEGPDVIVGTDDNELLMGEGGNDQLYGKGGNDKVYGFAGDDILTPGLGNDDSDGGEGTDTINYVDHLDGVTVSLDGVANDGSPALNETDNATTVENIGGSQGNDLLIGDAGPNWLIGSNGNDELRGNDGNDTFTGGPGADVLRGGAGLDSADWPPQDGPGPVTVTQDTAAGDGFAGENDLVGTDIEKLTGTASNDILRGGSARNELIGQAGNDIISGGLGNDTVDAGAGNDKIGVRDGLLDIVTCGSGTDQVVADKIDKLAADCEQVSYGFTYSGSKTTVFPADKQVKLVTVPLSCPAVLASTCSLDVTLVSLKPKLARTAATTLGRVHVTLAAGRSRKVKVRLTVAGRRALRRSGRVRARLTIDPRGLPGAATQTRTVVLRGR